MSLNEGFEPAHSGGGGVQQIDGIPSGRRKAKPAERRTAAFRIKAPSCEIIEAVSRSDVDAVGAHLETGAGTWKRRLRAFKGRAEVKADHGEALITNSSGFEVLGGERIDV